MRAGLPISIALHGALFVFALVSFQNAKPKEEIVFVDAIDAVPITEVTEVRRGKTTAPDKPEPTPKDLAAAAKETAGERAGTTRQEQPPPPPPPKPREVAALSPPEPPKPPEPKPEPVKAPEPPPVPKPDKPVEAEKAPDAGEGSPAETKRPEQKDKAALDKLIAAETKPDKTPEAKKAEPPKLLEKKGEPKPVEKKSEPADKKPEAKTPATTPAPKAPATKAAAAPQAAPAVTPTRFDPSAIARTLQSRETTGTAAAPEKKQATLGSPRSQLAAVKMSLNELDALKGQIQRCWSPPPGAAEANIKVTVRFSLNPDGTLSGQPSVVQAPAHPLGPPLAASARRAIIQCAPYRLPAEKYAVWQDIQPTFDPNDL